MTPSSIAYARYRDALFHAHPVERTVTEAITCLEALFLTGEQELKHRLAQRAAALLRLLETHTDSLQTYDDIHKGYKVRSRFIHGGSLGAQERPDADRLAQVLLECARASTLAFLQTSIPKTQLLEMLDNALIDPESATELANTVKSIVYR